MLHLLSKPASRDAEPVPTAVVSAQETSTPVFISEQQVGFATQAAAAVPRTTAHRHWPGTRVIAAVHHIHIGVPEPRPIYPRREAIYFEVARMSRYMDHL